MRVFFALALCLLLAVPAAADDSDKAAKEFIKKLQQLASKDQREDIAKLISFPLDGDIKPQVKNAAAFIKGYDKIFTPAVKECLAKHDMKEEVNSIKGAFMVGWGCVWFEEEDNGKMSIVSINTTP